MSARRAQPAPAQSVQDLSGSYFARQPLTRPGICLLDVNVLIALCDGRHEHHTTAAQWFVAHAAHGWASCPLTQNGAIRIMSTPAYPGARPVSQVLAQVQAMCASPHHHFWADSASLVTPGTLNPAHLLGHCQLTDAYLLALAVQNQGRFVTLDGAVPVQAVVGAQPDDLVRLI